MLLVVKWIRQREGEMATTSLYQDATKLEIELKKMIQAERKE
jgi:hypothetical protein